MVNIEINGKAVQAPEGAMVIEVADQADITIPRFCYHKKLSIAANCRMCLVEVEKVGKPLPACATPVTEGMKVFTRSPKALAAQRGVMEFLLINHPLDCPICDQGGECDLQEMAMGFGNDVSQYSEAKRVVASKNLGPLIATDMTRCIHCTRCVRFGQEVAGVMELGATGRGEHTSIGTYVERTVDSELSANVIDLCPVGALTSKPFRYSARPWELKGYPSVSPHDCVGANLRVDVRGKQVMRVVPRENEALNETWLADRDRFSYEALDHAERLSTPMLKSDGKWQAVDWDTALTAAADGLKRVAEQHGAAQLGALGAATATCEELYLLQKLLRGLGSHNIDHRLRQQDFRAQAQAPLFPALGQAIAELESQEAVLLVGANPRQEQPLLNHRLRKAQLDGGRIMAINPVDYDFNYPLAARQIATPAGMVQALAGVAKALLEGAADKAPAGLDKLLASVKADEAQRQMAEQLRDAERATLLLGAGAAASVYQSELRALAQAVAEMAGARIGVLAEGGNSAGAWLAGALPHRGPGGAEVAEGGQDWRGMFNAGLKGYVLLGVEPERDCADPAAARAALSGAECVVALSAFADDSLYELADVLLPIALFPETSGSYVNAEGRWQSVSGCTEAPGEARPAWKILRVLGNLFDLDGFDYMGSDEIAEELQAACQELNAAQPFNESLPKGLPGADEGIVRLAEVPLYAVDGMVRRSAALQQTAAANTPVLSLHPATAERLGLGEGAQVRVEQGGTQVNLPLTLDARVAEGCALIPAALAETGALGCGTVSLAQA